MSQRFVIDINVNGAGGSGGGRGSGGGNATPLAAGAAGAIGGFYSTLADSRREAEKIFGDFSASNQVGFRTWWGENREDGLQKLDVGEVKTSVIKRGLLKNKLQVEQQITGIGMKDPSVTEPFSDTIDYKNWLGRNTKQVRNLGVAAAWKTADALVNRAKYTSGDSYQNKQLDIGMKLAGYGAALAMSGPAAPLVAAGIIGNEVINVISAGAQYNYNLKLERQQITNMKAVAGNISYGRDRGGI